MHKVPQRIKEIAKRTAFLEHSKAEWQGNFARDAKTGKISLKTGAGLTATKMYLKAIMASFLKPVEQAREIRKWARAMQNHAIAALTLDFKEGTITEAQYKKRCQQVFAETNGAIRKGFKRARMA